MNKPTLLVSSQGMWYREEQKEMSQVTLYHYLSLDPNPKLQWEFRPNSPLFLQSWSASNWSWARRPPIQPHVGRCPLSNATAYCIPSWETQSKAHTSLTDLQMWPHQLPKLWLIPWAFLFLKKGGAERCRPKHETNKLGPYIAKYNQSHKRFPPKDERQAHSQKEAKSLCLRWFQMAGAVTANADTWLDRTLLQASSLFPSFYTTVGRFISSGISRTRNVESRKRVFGLGFSCFHNHVCPAGTTKSPPSLSPRPSTQWEGLSSLCPCVVFIRNPMT